MTTGQLNVFLLNQQHSCLHSTTKLEGDSTGTTVVEEVAATGTVVVAIPTVAIGEELTVSWEVLLLHLQIYLSCQRHREDDTS